jgi:exonuclease 3'-5' domain-containing protein 1
LISLRTTGTESSKTYLIDAISLTNDNLRPLFDIIQSSSPTKIVFDGRMDFSALYHGRGITLHGVLDLQLVDVDSRRQRGEDEDEQLRRLSPYLHRREIFGQRNSYTKVHKLCGLEQCLREHKVISDGLGHKSGNEIFSTDEVSERVFHCFSGP